MSIPLTSIDFRRIIRILIVADGAIHFSERPFGLSEFVNRGLLEGVNAWSRLQITTARRFEDKDGCADKDCFKFDDGSLSTQNYDQVWLFGQIDERNEEFFLSDSEVEAISAFMNSGGGVFATGDHESLGAAMCGNIPRVRSMRKWFYNNATSATVKSPGKEDDTRLDTLQIGDPGFQMDDQSDSIPQHIQPKYFREPCGSSSYPHPLLVGRRSPITVLPDHMHEGECLVPDDLCGVFTNNGKTYQEFPELDGTKVRLAPETVAIATSSGGYWIGELGNGVTPVEPRSFKVIVAYEGDRVLVDHRKIGRVVVDSSFHHFVDINLKGTGANNPYRSGFYDSNGSPTRYYEAIKQYYRNIALWLSPHSVQRSLYEALMVDMRFNSFLLEEISPIEDPNWNDILHAGAATRKALVERFSEAEVIQCCLSLLNNISPRLASTVEGLINPWRPASLVSTISPLAINQRFFVNSILGSSMLAIATHLPTDVHGAAEILNSNQKARKELTNIIKAKSNRAMSQISSVIDGSRERLGEVSAMLSELAEVRGSRD